ncbi:MAG: hypothetical protein ABIQ32_03720 [Sphingomicrobium sp.]
MAWKMRLLPVLLAAPALGGCALQAALAAAELAEYVPGTERQSNAHLTSAATEACTERARQYGSVYIVQVEQRRTDLIIVWGSVTDAQQRRSTFECRFTTALTDFKLREIRPAS